MENLLTVIMDENRELKDFKKGFEGYRYKKDGEDAITLVFWATMFDKFEILKYLFSHCKFNINTQIEDTMLSQRSWGIFTFFTPWGYSYYEKLFWHPNDSFPSDKQTCLHIAYINENKNIIKFLLDKGIDPEIKDFEGRTALDIMNNRKEKKEEEEEI